MITLAHGITLADRITINISNTEVETYTRWLDILPGDFNDDGVVNVSDGMVLFQHFTPANTYQQIYDFNGDGAVNMSDFLLYRPFVGSSLPELPQKASGAERVKVGRFMNRSDVPSLTQTITTVVQHLPSATVIMMQPRTNLDIAIPSDAKSLHTEPRSRFVTSDGPTVVSPTEIENPVNNKTFSIEHEGDNADEPSPGFHSIYLEAESFDSQVDIHRGKSNRR